MVRFFQKIRQNLLRENRITRYLLYALGEIILVVIGILIALAINNSNEQRKDRDKERLVLLQLQEEYQANLSQLEEKMGMRQQMIASINRILYYIDHPEQAMTDSLVAHFSYLIMDPTFDPIQNDLTVSGNVRLLRNESLKKLLTRWTSEVVQLTEVELQWQKLWTEVYIPFIIRRGIARDITNSFWKDENPPVFILNQKSKSNISLGNSRHTPALEDLLTDRELEGIVVNAFTMNYVANLQAETLRDRINEILAILANELRK